MTATLPAPAPVTSTAAHPVAETVTRMAARTARRYPVTIALTAGLWLVALVTGSVTGPPARLTDVVGAGPHALFAGHWWSLLTAPAWCANLTSYLVTTAVVLALLPIAERALRRGTLLAVLLGVQVTGLLAGCVIAAVMAEGARWNPLSGQVVLGPSGAVIGAVLAATTVLQVHQRWRLRTVLVSWLAMFALYSGDLVDLTRFTAGLAGLAMGVGLLRRRFRSTTATPAPRTPAHQRLLIAVLVAVSALGPLLAAISETHIGPLAVLRYVFTSPTPDNATVTQVCADHLLPRTCTQLQAQQRFDGIGPALMSVLPVLLLVIAAEGLRRGRRAAWLTAVLANTALAALGTVLAVRVASGAAMQRIVLGPGVHTHAWLDVVLPTAQPAVLVVVLLCTRRLFTVTAQPGAGPRGLRRSALVLAVCSLVYLVGSVLAAGQYRPAPSVGQVFADLPTRFLPPNYLGGFPPAYQPAGVLTRVLYEWTGVVFWVALGATLLATFVRCTRPDAGAQDKAAVRALLGGTGGSSLAHLATWPGQSYWFAPDGRAAIAYRLVGGVAVTTGHPVGAHADQVRAVRGFVEHCARQGFTPCLYSVTGDLVDVTSGWGWGRVQVAEEAVLALPELKFTGRKWQDVRTALNRADRAGVTPLWLRYREAPASIAEQIQSISAEWLSDKGLPEMGFTLGGLGELADDDVDVLAAIDRDGTIHAVTSWLPVHRDGVLVGRTLDFMRRRHDAFNGVMEFLIATAALTYRDRGLEWLSLSGAPLARVDRGRAESALQRTLEFAGRTLEPAYGFRSLLAFKAKFQPAYRPLYLAYPDPLALPAIAYAIGHAYLPSLTARQAARLAATLRRRSKPAKAGKAGKPGDLPAASHS